MNKTFLVGILAATMVYGCDKPTSTPPVTRPVSSEDDCRATPPPSPPDPFESILSQKTMRDALDMARPLMVDRFDEHSRGTVLFTIWASKNLQWQDIGSRPITSYKLVQKDVQSEITGKMCISGSILQISKEASQAGPIFNGLIITDAAHIFDFFAVKSTGDLVQDSTAKFCGIVTGLYDYNNSGGGTDHAVTLVGMFDLPENKPSLKKTH